MNSCLGVRADNEVCVWATRWRVIVRAGDLAVVHECPPFEVYALQSGSRSMR